MTKKLSPEELERYRNLLKHRVINRQQFAKEIGCSLRHTYVVLPRSSAPRGPAPGAKYRERRTKDEMDFDGLCAQRRAISEQRRDRERQKRARLLAELSVMR